MHWANEKLWGREKDFSPRHRVLTGSGTVRGDLCLGVKRPGREADRSHLYSAEIQNVLSCCLHTPSGNVYVKELDIL
jgi:hypothetical protein